MTNPYIEYDKNVSRSALFEDEEALPIEPPVDPALRLIAYYLPQFHAIPENDLWWGPGFTEWTNVAKAMPRYTGHYQPRMPGNLGFYDLRYVETLHHQAELAKRGGIHGFCIHHYWFSGRSLLEKPLKVLLDNPDIDLKFCLNWANESWTRRWDGSEKNILLEQRYNPGDDIRFINSILPALRDPRYIRVQGRPLLMMYRPAVVPQVREWVDNWRTFLVEAGVGDPYLVMAHAFGDEDPRKYGMDAAAGFPPHNGGFGLPNLRDKLDLLDPDFKGKVHSFGSMITRTLQNDDTSYRLFPGVCPNWDNEARKPRKGVSFVGSSPEHYGQWLLAAATKALSAAHHDERLVFVNAWNEWAEGAYLEPDRHFGFAYLAETRRILDSLSRN